jgi:hypothetical protein
MFTPSRDEARRFFFETWRKYGAGEPLSQLEALALKVIGWHPEYHALLDHPERHLERDYAPESGTMNPFLHLSLHLAVEEQLAIDQPPGLRARYRQLLEKTASEHDARHIIVECLGETVWQAQRNGTAPDAAAYLECVGGKAESAQPARGRTSGTNNGTA